MTALLSFLKSIGWFVYLSLVGIFQLLVIYVYKEFSNEKLDINDFIFNGFFLFLCVSTLAGICYEFYLENKVRVSKYISFGIAAVSCMVIIISMLIYSVIYFENLELLQASKKINLANNIKSKYVNFHIYIILITITISLSLKSLIYYNQEGEITNG